MNTSAATAPKPLKGWRVLVPRGGPWGASVAAALRAQGATPVIAPLINFAPSEDPTDLESALRAGDKEAATKQFDRGAALCSSCHKAFRDN